MKKSIYIILVTFLFTISGCEWGLLNNRPDETGVLTIHLTDAPFPVDIIEEANITISRVELKMDPDENKDKYMTLLEDTLLVYNLMDLRNGITELMLETEVPVGTYNAVRIYLTNAEILLIDSGNYDLKVPGGEQTGIKVKIDPPVEVVTELSGEILLDVDVSKSFVMKGNMSSPDKIQGFNFKPVLRAVNYTTTGAIAGIVSDPSGQVLENMEVWIESDSVLTTAYTDLTGLYGMLGIPTGTYDMHATGPGYDTATHHLVQVVDGNRQNKNFTLTPQ